MPKRVLIVDDEKYLRYILKMNLEKIGIEVSEAENGKVAIELINNIRPDLIILDIMMPDINGFEVLKTIKQSLILSQIPVIMLSARSQKKDMELAKALGAYKYIVKPFQINEFLTEVKNILSLKETKHNFDTKAIISQIQNIVEKNNFKEIRKLEDYLINDEYPTEIRVEAALALGKLKSENSVNLLLDTIDYAEPILKEKIIWALGKINNKRAFGKLNNILRDKNEPQDIRMACVLAIKSLGFESEVQDIIDAFKNKKLKHKKNKD